MSNISDIKDSFKKYIISPSARFGLGGFVFDRELDLLTERTSLITDHFIEDNSAVQDHIAILPERITLKSIAGDLVFFARNTEFSDFNVFQKAAQKLTEVELFLTKLSSAEQQFRESIDDDDLVDIESDAFDNLLNLWDLTRSLNPGRTNKEQAFIYFNSLFENRTLVAVSTPFGFRKNMAIEHISALEPEETQSIINFTIILKEFRTVSTETVPFTETDFQERAKFQKQPETNNGSSNGEQVEPYLLIKTLDSFEAKP